MMSDHDYQYDIMGHLQSSLAAAPEWLSLQLVPTGCTVVLASNPYLNPSSILQFSSDTTTSEPIMVETHIPFGALFCHAHL